MSMARKRFRCHNLGLIGSPGLGWSGAKYRRHRLSALRYPTSRLASRIAHPNLYSKSTIKLVHDSPLLLTVPKHRETPHEHPRQGCQADECGSDSVHGPTLPLGVTLRKDADQLRMARVQNRPGASWSVVTGVRAVWHRLLRQPRRRANHSLRGLSAVSSSKTPRTPSSHATGFTSASRTPIRVSSRRTGGGV
jgi:hypothetical protein